MTAEVWERILWTFHMMSSDPLSAVLYIVVHIAGRIMGRFLPWRNIGRNIVIAFVASLMFMVVTEYPMYEFYFIFGVLFITGVWRASRKWSF